MENIKIAIIGLGYVGLPLAVEFAKKNQVVGFDINKPRIEELLSGTDSTLETTDDECGALGRPRLAGGRRRASAPECRKRC